MRTASRKHNFYGMVAISIILLICSSLMYKYLIQQKYPSHTPKVSIKQQFHSPAIDHTACGIKSRRVQRRAWSLLDINVTSSLPLPRVGSYQCRDQICSEFLSVKDRITIHKCHHDKCQKFPIKIAPKCHFMNGTHRSPVALVSFPGSGNTWVRGLLEKATGICTGIVSLFYSICTIKSVLYTLGTIYSIHCIAYSFLNNEISYRRHKIHVCLHVPKPYMPIFNVILHTLIAEHK